MPTKKDVLIIPAVSEYLYDCLTRATYEQKKNLKLKYAKAVKNSKTAKTFAATSSWEDKAIVLSKLGIEFSFVFNLNKTRLMELYRDKNDLKPGELADYLLREKIMVVTDKQVLHFLNLLASNAHSEVWMMNRDFLKAGYNITDWKKEYFNTNLEEIKGGSRSARDVAKLMSATMLYAKFAPTLLGIQDVSVAVLLYIFSKDKEFIRESEIRLYFNGVYRNFKLGKSINDLLKTKFIEHGHLTKTKEYRITSYGTEAALRFQKKIFGVE